jgi:HTH-type transcriptional regulator/antitoxin HigA
MEIRPIRNNEDYEAALLEVAPYFEGEEPDLDSLEGQRFDVLVTLIEAYEAKHFPADLPDPIEAIKFRMEQQGLTPKDLVPMIGRVNRVYEVLNGKRHLTLPMIWNIHKQLGIPASSLICPPRSLLAA